MDRYQLGKVISWITAVTVCCFLVLSCISFSIADAPSTAVWPNSDPLENWCGQAGASLAFYLFHYFGTGTYVLLLFAVIALLARASNTKADWLDFWLRGAGVALLVVVAAATLHLVAPGGNNTLPVGNGGVVGLAAGEFLRSQLSIPGACLILLCSCAVALLLAADNWVLRVPMVVRGIMDLSRPTSRLIRRENRAAAVGAVGDIFIPGRETDDKPPVLPKKTRKNPQPAADEVGEEDFDDAYEQPDGSSVDDQTDDLFDEEVDDEDDEQSEDALEEYEDEDEDEHEEAEDGVRPSLEKIKANLTVRLHQPPETSSPPNRDLGDYKLPPLDLLEDPEYGFASLQEKVVREKAAMLERALNEFNIDARVAAVDTGPVITMFELELAAGVKVSAISSLSNDLARALAAPSVRIVAPVPGKHTVGIEVPNTQKEKVRLKELMGNGAVQIDKMSLPLYLGKDAGGEPILVDLTTCPHMLVAGTTGSGKSVCLNSIIMSILLTQRPDRVKMILVDPKMVEMSMFKEVPHLMCPIVNDMKRAESILDWAVTKMDERYALLAEARVKNIAGYNKLSQDQILERFSTDNKDEIAKIPMHLPYVVIIIDELADLMMTSAKEVEYHLSRLAQKSRAVGIHIILATQRPQANVVTGLIKSNLPSRIAFRVSSRMDSRIVLDQNGAELLLGQGDMLFLKPGDSKLIRAQGTFVADDEVRSTVKYLKEIAEPDFHLELIQLNTANPEIEGDRDELFDEAVRIILESQRGSVSLLQRRLTIGYSRASRLVDQMATAGIVGAYKGSQAREVNMTLEEWEALQQQIADETVES